MNWINTVFLSYAREDKLYVKKLYRKLEENGFTPWMDQQDLKPGVPWGKKTEEAIKKARFFLACLSHQSVFKNGEVQKEWRTALGELEKKAPGTIYFIPVLIEDDVELPDISVGTIHLRDYHAIKIVNDEGIQKLTTQLKEETNTVNTVKKKESPKQKIQKYIAEDQMDTAMKLLKNYAEEYHSEWNNDIILISARYNNLKRQYRKGILSQQQYSLEKNKITYAFLELIQQLQ